MNIAVFSRRLNLMFCSVVGFLLLLKMKKFEVVLS
jgi:hypothetical protein